MIDAKCIFLRRVTAFCSSAALILMILIAAAPTTAAQTNVFVPGTATGCFGNDPIIGCEPLIPAIAVSGPATITVTYVSGTVIWDGNPNDATGPDGTDMCTWCRGAQTPLNEALGAGQGKITQLAALIGVFVPQERVQHAGFNPLDGTKNMTQVGVLPDGLFFIGTGKTGSVNEAGTLYLGINDYGAADNSGGFNVTVSAQ